MASALMGPDDCDRQLSSSPADAMKAKSRQSMSSCGLFVDDGAAEEADGSGSGPGAGAVVDSSSSGDSQPKIQISAPTACAAGAVVVAEADCPANCLICHTGLIQERLDRCLKNNRSLTCAPCDTAETACMVDARAQGQNKEMLKLKQTDFANILACATLPLFPNSLPLSVCRLRFNR
jgi:hypothetical protein